ncbi:hypothetical protein RRG08_057343 [Elysia crispata]|uniref:Uncharacterized protein n=1 Tax=Elysia crispata TaxID=231223 RepID=A0AAE0YK45_9GAST|nr:hypothetical protein RRG08_057343 [Elysia crispata]
MSNPQNPSETLASRGGYHPLALLGGVESEELSDRSVAKPPWHPPFPRSGKRKRPPFGGEGEHGLRGGMPAVFHRRFDTLQSKKLRGSTPLRKSLKTSETLA